MRLLGATKVTTGKKIALIADVAKEMDIKEGDVIGFYKSDKGDIIIKKG